MSNFDEYLQNIHDINLSYLLLVQQLIREDKFAAGFRLGLSEGTIDNLKELSLPQLMKLATTNQLICRLRVDDEVVIENLTRIRVLKHCSKFTPALFCRPIFLMP